MTRLLHVESSPRGDDSVSTRVAREFLHAWSAHAVEPDIDTLNVWEADLPEFDPSAVGTKYKLVSGEELDDTEAGTWDRVTPLVERVLAADRMVVCSPMWNWSVPYKLKQFIDLVSQRDRLFTFDGERYGPLLDLERALIVGVRGQGRGTPAPTAPDREGHVEYLRFWLETIGSRHVDVIDVDHTWDDRSSETLRRGLAEARALAARF